MLVVNAATFESLRVQAEQNDIVISCHDENTRLIAPGKSERFCRIEIKMPAVRSDDQKRQLRSNICRSLQPFGLSDDDVKLIVTDVPKRNLGR